ncbi:ABC transporter ATP-binding protein (plasmid) [Haloferax mediterranei ATCC 33500]|uniref:Molybdate/tungstate import ATP-binding protein WtpC n=1 Tax=Haloferax mediterranei (strain ATCC 33500 / DSM 1411 / JCM 8866 / NBRC 14739 / NCIMB 2177 / R-4) TaxID=523841 RepID=I3RAE4_HALMT|nr:ABC transporter ATP-binding protein [Haloferax mediterranei]AFK21204.1 ABC-type sulfate/molybdate transport systems,ATP-binding protein [Haloferax mediterranei ATCC 33500]AHZ24686.1 sulfate ABC transporter ATP-binding protein [Haloferax mediterranei ATCC 33500]ELZ97462.1 ABC-type sulfate/molybdate transport system, ATP-binding protein [Haloferax mediterranei ATCC 33500]MDX5990247.1 ABC transporter ATP-binding protein [Haloferax mediterranei ATCC 33500]QCQ76685.1 ABC transporter ATP-binding 
MARITLDGVTKRFDESVAVDGLDLEIADGETLGVVGPSGCGKTTTLRMIAGFETPTSGSVRFDGEDVTHRSPETRNVGLVFQSYALFDNMSVLENVTFGPKMHGVDREERRTRARELLAMLDIDDLAMRNPRTLSGGQQQRVGIARALAIEPKILLLDEPMTGLDAKLKRELRRELADLLSELGVTALYVTHDQDEAMEMTDRIAVLNDGHLEQVGSPEALYERPANRFVAEFVGASNLLSARPTTDGLDLGYATVDSPLETTAHDTVTVVARPDDITLCDDGIVTAEIEDVTYLGERAESIATLPDGTSVTVRFDPRAEHVVPGDETGLSFDTERLHVVERY